jgi:F-type H+-transporting ATPase subunit delta
MTDGGAARRYAHALFDVASRTDAVTAVQRDLANLAAAIASHDELRHVLEAPAIPPEKKRDILGSLLQQAGPAAAETSRLLVLLADRDRLTLLPEIAAAFQARQRLAARTVSAAVTTAVPLDEAGRAALARALGQATGLTVSVTERVDPAIIGGVVAQVGSLVFDGSVARQLERMRERLLAEA